jgi:hypothetical protein
MNVYTHVAMNDLRAAVETLPGLGGGAGPQAAGAPAVVEATPGPADAPAELAGLISAWKDLPDNVRSAIAALART